MEVTFAVADPPPPPAPLTWGQHAIWAAIHRTVPNDHYFNLARVVVPPVKVADGLSVDAARTAVRAVIEANPGLRTRIAPGPRRRVEQAGRVPLAVAELTDGGGPDAAAAALVERLGREAFDYTDEYPLRPGLVVDDAGRVARIVLVLCHLAADGAGADLIVGQLRLALLRRTGRPPGDPDTLAAFEESAPGRTVSRAAVSHWLDGWRLLPDGGMVARPVATEQPVRWWVGALTSRALGLAAATLARRHRTSSSAVLLAVSGALIAAERGVTTTVLPVIVGNRFQPGHRDVVATVAQEGLFVLDHAAVGTVGELLDLARPAALRAYRAGYYDQRALDAALERLDTGSRPYCCFNDMRLTETPPGAPPAPGEIEAARTTTVFGWQPPQAKVACRYCLHLTAAPEAGPGALRVTVTGDTRYLPPRRIEAHLRALESTVVAAVAGSVPLATLTP
ncbi:non-ribosomal peptide synthetase condensation domain protein [Micromonospora robiginosa]|uniref:Uncharacterized protein n=1 Tax=Micromonospora robiginosa TaxID=2749844 RepID=A0A7L6B3Z1_9ACTN|nr:non-ribosomal peptide synthetase condensation domain protein [Micromonospora ferruginea]QLQ36649.1 hypothetical protein H1D33_25840 [Micromonospora ferruginea]